PIVVEVPLRPAVVDPEAGRAPTGAGRRIAMANQRNVGPLTRASPPSSAAEAGRNVKSSAAVTSAAAQPPTSITTTGRATTRATTEMTAGPVRRIGTSAGDGWRESSRPEPSRCAFGVGLAGYARQPNERTRARPADNALFNESLSCD